MPPAPDPMWHGQGQRPIERVPARPVLFSPLPVLRPVARPDNQDIDRGYWRGHVTAVPVQTKPAINRPVHEIPTGMRVPDGVDPNIPVMLNTNCPPWVCPPFWSVPVSKSFTTCLPFYEQDELMGCFSVPAGYFLVINEISYQALNAVQYDAFDFVIRVNGQLKVTVEDTFVDGLAPNPAQRYALSGHFKPLRTWFIADRNSRLCVHARLRGPISMAGVSPYAPGTPIASPDCHMTIILHGWLANMRNDLDGGPRPTDVGDGA